MCEDITVFLNVRQPHSGRAQPTNRQKIPEQVSGSGLGFMSKRNRFTYKRKTRTTPQTTIRKLYPYGISPNGVVSPTRVRHSLQTNKGQPAALELTK